MKMLHRKKKKTRNRLYFSEHSFYSSADVMVTDRHMELFLQPGNKNLIIYMGEIKKLARAFMALLMKRMIRFLLNCMERTFQRRRWINRNYFELGSLLNLILGTLAASHNSSGNPEKLRSARDRVVRVLKNYRKTLYAAYRKIDGAGEDTEQIKKTLRRTAEIVYRELIRVHGPYERNVRVREFFKAILKEYHIIS